MILLSLTSFRFCESTELIRLCNFYESDDFDFILHTIAQIVSFMLCCICSYVFNDRAIIMTTRDCEDLEDWEDTDVLCLNIFSVIAKSNWQRSKKCSDVSSIKDDSSFKRRDFDWDLILLLKYIICLKQRTASQNANWLIAQLKNQIREFSINWLRWLKVRVVNLIDEDLTERWISVMNATVMRI